VGAFFVILEVFCIFDITDTQELSLRKMGGLKIMANMDKKILRITVVAMLTAVAYVLTAVLRIPLMPEAPFLKYDPKDIVIVITGFIYGPATAVIMGFVLAFLEFMTVGTSGLVGFIMNFIACVLFAGTASFIYKKKKDIVGVILGLVAGTLLLTAGMMLWNYIITPIYQGWPRETVAAMLLPVFMPFNLIKGGINSGLILVLHKPILMLATRMGLCPASKKAN